MEMAAQVLIAHTGQRLELDTSQYSSYVTRFSIARDLLTLGLTLRVLRLDDFKASVARQSSIPPQCIIALTAQGRPLKLQTIQAEVCYNYVRDHNNNAAQRLLMVVT
jgi:autophagy-related protein 11